MAIAGSGKDEHSIDWLGHVRSRLTAALLEIAPQDPHAWQHSLRTEYNFCVQKNINATEFSVDGTGGRLTFLMLEILDLSQKLKKSDYVAAMPALRAELRDLQLLIYDAGIPVVILFEGLETAGKGDSIGTLVYPMDPRGFKVYSTHAPTEEERFRPFLWRFWTKLPAQGRLALLDRAWYRRMLEERVDGDIDQQGLLVAAGAIRDFERQITDDGLILIKFWLHISKKEQKRRFADIKNDRFQQWRLKQPGQSKHRKYQRWLEAAEEMLEQTSTAYAPWNLIEADDRYLRRRKVMDSVVAGLRNALKAKGIDPSSLPALDWPPSTLEIEDPLPPPEVPSTPSILDRIDLSKKLDRAEYERRLDPLQSRLRDLELECYRQRVPVVVVYEGSDAAGKGGNIKRLTQEMDPRGYEVIPISAPDSTEKSHHYLWRFWRQLPKAGHIAIFDRSWYGRVLVERVEGFAKENEWGRAYQEINEFEHHQVDFGTVLVKFWLQISPEEQLRRFRERERVPYKHHKITPDDWRNRSRWNDYRTAVVTMMERTSTSDAPWTIVEAEDKLWARIKTLDTLVRALEERLRV